MHDGNPRIWHFDSLVMAWHQTQTSIASLTQLPRVVLWMEMPVPMYEIKDAL